MTPRLSPRSDITKAATIPIEAQPTLAEEDAITRAMKRRVEMFLVTGGRP